MSSGKHEKQNRGWRKDYFAWCEVAGQFWNFWLFFGIMAIALLGTTLHGCKKDPNLVIVYTSQDQEYAEPIFKEFTKQTGIEVRAVFDSEAVKTVGLVNRLLAEKNHPQCDLFWNNEELRTRQLEKFSGVRSNRSSGEYGEVAQEAIGDGKPGVLRETNPWDSFGFRARRLVINTNQLANLNCPRTLAALTNESCRGKIALAYPLFGTTATHFLVLRQIWGEERWLNWCRALAANKPFLVDGNSVVVKMVARGEAWIGLTDSDDIRAAKREGLPIDGVDLVEENFFIRNTVAVIRNAPHPDAAQKLFEFLKSDFVGEKLSAAGASEGSAPPQSQQVDWDKLLQTQGAAVAQLKEIFLR